MLNKQKGYMLFGLNNNILEEKYPLQFSPFFGCKMIFRFPKRRFIFVVAFTANSPLPFVRQNVTLYTRSATASERMAIFLSFTQLSDYVKLDSFPMPQTLAKCF